MMNITEKIKDEIMLLNDKFMTEAEDKYDFWNEHIKYVLNEAIDLAGKYNADVEIVELSALLHDIALISKIGTRAEHHITGAELAREMLEKYEYPQEKIDKVRNCVLNHRSSKNGISIEDICVADADILAHFDNVPMIFNSIFRQRGITLPEVRKRLKDSFDADYNDLSERTKQEFNRKYISICKIVLDM